MDRIIGLKNTLSYIDNLKTLPNSFTLIGERGSGKHLIIEYINKKFFTIPYLDITDELDEGTLNNIYTYPQKRLYVIDISMITEKTQNILLKFLEEPYINIFIVLLTESIDSLLPTIKNRVINIYLDKYSIEELKEVANSNDIKVDDKYYKSILKTPGDVLRLKDDNIDLSKIDVLSSKIVNDIYRASFTNTLSLSEKINFKDEYDKIDLDFLLSFLVIEYMNKYIEKRDDNYLKLKEMVMNVKKNMLLDKRLDKKKLFTSLLIDLWERSKEWN